MTAQEKPYQVTALEDLAAAYSAAHFRYAINEVRKVIALVVAEDNRSSQQIARVRILRNLDLQLSRASKWAEDEADLMATILRTLIELRAWAKFVSKGEAEAKKFLDEATIDMRELHEKMSEAFPGELAPLPAKILGNRMSLGRENDIEDYNFKLCSKLIHPSSLSLNHPEQTIQNREYREHLAKQVLYYGWRIVSRFHNIEWTE
jgi:hypothetical protein